MSTTNPAAERVTRHFVARGQQRGLRPELRDFIYWHGVAFDGAGATHITLVERELPADVQHDPRVAEARDWVLVLASGDVFVTCYRRPHATRFLRRKCSRRHYAPVTAMAA